MPQICVAVFVKLQIPDIVNLPLNKPSQAMTNSHGDEGWGRWRLVGYQAHLFVCVGCYGNSNCALGVSAMFSEQGTRDYRKYDMTFLLDQTILFTSKSFLPSIASYKRQFLLPSRTTSHSAAQVTLSSQ